MRDRALRTYATRYQWDAVTLWSRTWTSMTICVSPLTLLVCSPLYGGCVVLEIGQDVARTQHQSLQRVGEGIDLIRVGVGHEQAQFAEE